MTYLLTPLETHRERSKGDFIAKHGTLRNDLLEEPPHASDERTALTMLGTPIQTVKATICDL